MIKKKLTQNIKSLIGRIGEDTALFKLYTLLFDYPELEVFKNFTETGYDIGINNLNTKKRIKIEVKTRQCIISSSSPRSLKSCHFTLSENERDSADFTIAYWIDHNAFFIIPNCDLKETKSKNKNVYKHVVSKLKKDSANYSHLSMQYLDNWNSILSSIQKI